MAVLSGSSRDSSSADVVIPSMPDVTRKLELPRQNPSASDFYICEFPKSGITFLTVLLANAFLAANDFRARATFASVRNYIVDLCVAELTESFLFNDPPVRFYKTHSIFSAQFIHSLYLVRHPADVMMSNFRYAQGRGWWNSDDIAAFVEHPVLGLDAWCRHVDSWLVENRTASDVVFVHLIRYEDLVADPTGVLKALDDNFGWNLPEHAIDEALRMSSRSAMREQESRYRQYNPNHEFEFVAAKESAVEQIVRQQVAARCETQLELLGYPKLDFSDAVQP